MRSPLTQTFLLTAALYGFSSSHLLAASCDSLSALTLDHVTISSVTTIDAGAFPAPPGRGPNGPAAYNKLPAFCRVIATLKPTDDSNIGVEVWLPVAGWNGRLQAVGNGAWAGSISYPALATALAAGYAAASTDTGHKGNNPDFIPGHAEKLNDFIYRSVHEMTVASKGIVSAFYGNPAKYAYWNGCSTGGRQALTEAQRYPNDYDGIIAGAPAAYITRLQGMQVWVSQQANRSADSLIPASKLSLIHDAVLKACDGLDGVKDGVLEDPTKCKFDPKILECKEGDGPNCLNKSQVETARAMYEGPSVNGKPVFYGVEPGTEKGWDMLASNKPMSFAVEIYKYAAFNMSEKDSWGIKDFKPEDIMRFEKEKGPTFNSVNPDLNAFFSHNGKLLMYHGWADPGVPPGGTVRYYESVVEKTGPKAKDDMRLFMIPGMAHCGGGDGTSTFDMVKAMDQWVEQGKAPQTIPASRMRDGKVDRTRPLCAYPSVAVYSGSGSTDEAANFSCK